MHNPGRNGRANPLPNRIPGQTLGDPHASHCRRSCVVATSRWNNGLRIMSSRLGWNLFVARARVDAVLQKLQHQLLRQSRKKEMADWAARSPMPEGHSSGRPPFSGPRQ